MSNGRFFLLTIPAASWTTPTELHPDLSWVRGQQETAASGFLHWQVACRSFKVSRISKIKTLFCPQAHVELSRSAAANDYVWKEDTRVEGTQFELGSLPVGKQPVDWQGLKDKAISGDLDSIDPGLLVRHFNSIARIHAHFARPALRAFIHCRVFVGPTGSGKTHRAMEEAMGTGAVYWKASTTKWWDGYHGEENVVIDEFDGQIGIIHLLRWLDKYPCSVEIKGGSTPLKAIRFWITSNNPVSQWFVNGVVTDAQRAALGRRVIETVIDRRADLE